MPKTHIVSQGEHISSIAAQHGFRDFLTIWEDAGNEALRTLRGTPNVLLPGDTVVIPDFEEKSVDAETDRRHSFRVHVGTLLLRLVLKRADGEPIAGATCELQVGAGSAEVVTKEDGSLEKSIPPDAKAAVLVVNDPEVDFDVEVPIRIGDLDPVETPSGQRARLRNLAYYFGSLEHHDEAEFVSAVEEFQCDNDLEVNGICDEPTQAQLRAAHGS